MGRRPDEGSHRRADLQLNAHHDSRAGALLQQQVLRRMRLKPGSKKQAPRQEAEVPCLRRPTPSRFCPPPFLLALHPEWPQGPAMLLAETALRQPDDRSLTGCRGACPCSRRHGALAWMSRFRDCHASCRCGRFARSGCPPMPRFCRTQAAATAPRERLPWAPVARSDDSQCAQRSV